MPFHSELLKLRKTTILDVDKVMTAEQDQHNRPYIGQWSREQHMRALFNTDMLHFIIEDAAGEFSGYVIITGLEDPNLATCIKRLVVVPKGQGYGTATLRLLKEWIFGNTDTHRLWLDVKDHNDRARRVYEGVGFTYEGTLRDCLKVGDSFESLQIMSILKGEYLAEVQA